jgi:hypothetical protein
MRPTLAFVVSVALVLLAFALATPAKAQPIDPKAVPEPLRPWTQWALNGKDDVLCAPMNGDDAGTPRCAWPSRLALDLDEHGGKLSQAWHLDAKRWVPLPGDAKRWPQDVNVDGARAVVIAQGGAPSVEIAPGDHVVTGTFTWDSLPESLRIPQETGLLALTIRGAVVASPNRDAQGVVWLQKVAAAEEGDNLSIVVHRKATDDIPLVLTTHVELHVSGKNRELLLGRALPSGFVPMSLESQLPARVEADGRLRVQARAGVFVVDLVARSEGPVNALARPDPGGPWREGDEVWVFEAKNDLRIVTIEGIAAIDPQQTTLPEAWKRLPAYPMKVGDTLRLVEKRRGDTDPPPNQISLSRKLWLDFDGSGYTASDVITGTMTRDWRLTMAAPTIVGRVSVGGKDQFITHLEGSSANGVEIRQGTLSVNADSRIPGLADIPAVGWAHDFHQVSGTLQVPPGWRLVHATGVDSVPGTWVHHWTLLEIFLALIIAIAIARLWGWSWGVISLGMLVLTLPENEAPKWTWLVVLAFEALMRVIKHVQAKAVFGWGRVGAFVLVALVTTMFLIDHVRQGMYPALGSSPESSVSAVDEETRQQSIDMKEGGTGTKAAPVGGAGAPPPPRADVEQERAEPPKAPAPAATFGSILDYRKSNAQVYDPTAAVQTGPGLPRWEWTRVSLGWSGPVTASQRLHLYLLSPRENLALALVRAILLIAVLVRMMPWKLRIGSGAKAAPIIALALTLLPTAARADVPTQSTLDDLRDRLTQRPTCSPSCAASSRLAIEVRAGVLRARMSVEAAARTSVPLPSSAQWAPTEVLLDGKAATALARANDGVLWIELGPGAHDIALAGAMPDRESMQLSLHMKSHRVQGVSEGWTIAGLHEDGLADDDLQLTRVRRAEDAGAGSVQPGALPPFVRIERTLEIALDWHVSTRIVRATPTGSAIVLEVPLLAGESVTTADVRVSGGKALVNMGPQVKDFAWRSTLDQKSPIKLAADKSLAWIEVWRADVGPIWHAAYSGIPFVHTEPAGDIKIPEWRPWPAEEASVILTRPAGVEGQTLTIDHSRAQIAPGLRATDVTLTLGVRSSRGAQHTLTIPEGAQLESVTINGAVQPIRQDGRRVTIGVVPGAQTIALVWREPRGIATTFDASSIDLGAPSVNTTIDLSVPSARWLLFVGGPRLGPAVLFWSMLLVLLVVAAALGRVRFTPIAWWQWMLLAIGLSQVGVIAGAFFVGWLIVLGWRKERAVDGVALFNVRQVMIVLWTIAALVILVIAMVHGLLGAPEMQVRGNGSTIDRLVWFADRSGATLPNAWMLSVPMMAYRGVMLAWALWAAISLLGWIKWGWGAFTEGGAWKKSPPRPPMQGPMQPPMQPPMQGSPWQGPPVPPGQPPVG